MASTWLAFVGSAPMIEEAESALRTMAKNLHPTTKSGLVRVLLPAIEDALKAGHTIKAVWQQLHEHNPALGYKEFCVYLARLRKRAHRGKSTGGYTHPGEPLEPAGVRSLGKPTAR